MVVIPIFLISSHLFLPKMADTERDKETRTSLQKRCHNKQGGVSHCGLAIYTKKYLKAKEELWKLKYNFTMQKYNLQKSPLIEKPKSFKIS
jgi:hypothetical protein